jgi:hypothetical protein
MAARGGRGCLLSVVLCSLMCGVLALPFRPAAKEQPSETSTHWEFKVHTKRTTSIELGCRPGGHHGNYSRSIYVASRRAGSSGGPSWVSQGVVV